MKPPAKKQTWTDLAHDDNPRARGDFQQGWQTYAGAKFDGVTILDVGAATGAATPRLARGGANAVTSQEPAMLDGVDTHADIYTFQPDSFDVVTAFDVLEHIEEDWPFVAQLVSIARRAVVLTTPNFNISRAKNPCHIREYTPAQLLWLASRLGHVAEVRSGDPRGREISEPQGPHEFTATQAPHLWVVLSPPMWGGKLA
jgi:2-polyprenyl-3-methyl-5-hydroxy-6-metoxy-1,4-benzoquinol methylase